MPNLTKQSSPLNIKNTVDNNSSVILEEGLTIALLTVTVYAAFLLKEIGYARVFDIPLDIITTREVGLALTAEAFLLGVLSFVAKVNFIWVFTPSSDQLIAKLVRKFIALALFLGFVMYPYLATDLSYWWFFVPLIAIFFFIFLWPLIAQREKNNYESKMEAQLMLDRNGNDDIISSILKLFGRQWDTTLYVIVGIMVFAYGLGKKEAIEQSSFFAVEGRPGWFVLKIYDDLVVTALIDVTHKQLEGEIELTKLAEGSAFRLRRVEIGALNKQNIVSGASQNNPARSP